MYSNMVSSSELFQKANAIIGAEIDNHPQRLRIMSSKRQSLSFSKGNEKSVFHLIAGEVEIRNIHNNLIIFNIYAPAILGLSTIFSPDDFHYVSTVTDAEFTSIPLSELINLSDHKNLWSNISVILSHYIKIYQLRDVMITQTSIYNAIRNHLDDYVEA